MENFITFVPVLVIVGMLFLLYLLIRFLIATSKPPRAETIQEQMLEDELKSLENITSIDALIHLYGKAKLCNKRFYYYASVKIITQLIKIKAFPKDVLEWLTNPKDYDAEDLSSIMEEFKALRSGQLKDAIAIQAYCDGFISATEALAYADRTKYPKTVDALLSDPEDYDEIRDLLEKERKLQNTTDYKS